MRQEAAAGIPATHDQFARATPAIGDGSAGARNLAGAARASTSEAASLRAASSDAAEDDVPRMWMESASDGWTPHAIEGAGASLLCDGLISLEDGEWGAPAIVRVRLRGEPDRWVLLAGACAVRVNGRAAAGGLVELHDRDEVCFAGRVRAFFSTERLAKIVPFPHADPLRCPRCMLPIAQHAAAVRCECGAWYHQGVTLCYTHASSCVTCTRRTRIDDGFVWTPDALDGARP